MMRTLRSFLATTFALAFAMPALARPMSSADVPSCDGDGKKDEKKDPSASPQCDGGGKDEKKDEKKDPSRL
jgi:hypothetical protein